MVGLQSILMVYSVNSCGIQTLTSFVYPDYVLVMDASFQYFSGKSSESKVIAMKMFFYFLARIQD